MNKNNNPTFRGVFNSPHWIHQYSSPQAWLDRLKQYEEEVKEPYTNPRSKADQVEELTAIELSLYKYKVESWETAENIT